MIAIILVRLMNIRCIQSCISMVSEFKENLWFITKWYDDARFPLSFQEYSSFCNQAVYDVK